MTAGNESSQQPDTANVTAAARFGELTGRSTRTASRYMRVFRFGYSELEMRQGLSITAADNNLRRHLHGDVPEPVARARRALADIRWLMDNGVIESVGEIFAIGLGLTCETCGKKFTAQRCSARYCSSACRQRAYRQRTTA